MATVSKTLPRGGSSNAVRSFYIPVTAAGSQKLLAWVPRGLSCLYAMVQSALRRDTLPPSPFLWTGCSAAPSPPFLFLFVRLNCSIIQVFFNKNSNLQFLGALT